MSWFYDHYNLYTVQIYLFLLLTQSSEPTKRIYLNRNLSFYYDKFDHLHFIRNVITEVACTKAKLPVAAWENGPLVYRIPGFCGGGDLCCGSLVMTLCLTYIHDVTMSQPRWPTNKYKMWSLYARDFCCYEMEKKKHRHCY
jgi:hypothetical protein